MLFCTSMSARIQKSMIDINRLLIARLVVFRRGLSSGDKNRPIRNKERKISFGRPTSNQRKFSNDTRDKQCCLCKQALKATLANGLQAHQRAVVSRLSLHRLFIICYSFRFAVACLFSAPFAGYFWRLCVRQFSHDKEKRTVGVDFLLNTAALRKHPRLFRDKRSRQRTRV